METSVFDAANTTRTSLFAAYVLIMQEMAELQVLGDVLSLKFLITGVEYPMQFKCLFLVIFRIVFIIEPWSHNLLI
jgi:hypothetical protein